MYLFKDYSFTWWQTGLLKVYVASGGLLIGAHFPEVVLQYTTILFAVFGSLMIYFIYAMMTKKL